MILLVTYNSEFYFERFYMSLLFSTVSFVLWFLLKNRIVKPIRKEKYENANEYLSWYLNYKFYLILVFLKFLFIACFIISIVSIIQYWFY
jgi:hypothetical protein